MGLFIPTQMLIVFNSSKRKLLYQTQVHMYINRDILAQTIINHNRCLLCLLCYKHIFGTPMGSPLSPIVAAIVLQDLKVRTIDRLQFKLPIYYRYVDDILFAAPTERLTEILDKFNSVNDRLQFTLEIGNNNGINFLDVAIVIDDQRIIFDRYEKPTSSGRYINYHSQHPVAQKKRVIFGLVDRVLLLSHPKFHKKNIERIINILLDNCYPLPFIFTTINKRIKNLMNKYNNNTSKRNGEQLPINNNDNKNFFTIPYVKTISESFQPIAKRYGFDVAYSVPNTLNKFIKRGKDKIEKLENNDCVYKINCLNCNATYVGQTKRQLGTRIKEHRSDINKKEGSLSVVSNHRIENDHDMNWSEAEILDIESSYNKRIVSEMVFIKKMD